MPAGCCAYYCAFIQVWGIAMFIIFMVLLSNRNTYLIRSILNRHALTGDPKEELEISEIINDRVGSLKGACVMQFIVFGLLIYHIRGQTKKDQEEQIKKR